MKMLHLDEERTQRVVDGELSPIEERLAREHLASCAACREKVVAAQQEKGTVLALLGSLDVPCLDESAPPRRRTLLRRAALVVIAFGLAGAAFAAPGSPLPDIVRQIARRVSGPPAETAPPRQVPPQPPPEPEPAVSGIVIPAGSNITIVFTSSQTGGFARVRLADVEKITVRGPAGAARFASEPDRLVIDNRGMAATYDIEVPHDAPRVEIRLKERTLFLKEGDRLDAPPPDPAGIHHLDLRTL